MTHDWSYRYNGEAFDTLREAKVFARHAPVGARIEWRGFVWIKIGSTTWERVAK
jgi:hypothetical protein